MLHYLPEQSNWRSQSFLQLHLPLLMLHIPWLLQWSSLVQKKSDSKKTKITKYSSRDLGLWRTVLLKDGYCYCPYGQSIWSRYFSTLTKKLFHKNVPSLNLFFSLWLNNFFLFCKFQGLCFLSILLIVG